MLRLKELREAKGLTQTAVANDLKLARQTYCNYENGKREPDTKTMRLMAKYFGVSLDYLFGEDNPPENKKIPKDLKKILDEEEVTLNGRMVSEEEKEQMLRVLEALYRDAKEKNKRK